MRLGIDLDGVCYRWSDTARYLLSHHRGHKHLGESTHWNYLPDNVSKEDWRWLWDEGVKVHGLFRHGNLFPGTIDALKYLAGVGHTLVAITSRPKEATEDTLDWIDFHRLPFTEVHVIQGMPKSAVFPRCAIYVDDAPKNVADLLDNTTAKAVCLMRRPWNQEITGLVPEAGRLVEDWQDFIKVVEEER